MTQTPTDKRGDQAFRNTEPHGRWPEMTYGGALSFLRRRYSHALDGVDVAVMGVPYDGAVTFRPGCRLGPQAIRAASVQLAELKAFPWGFDPFDHLAVVDSGQPLPDNQVDCVAGEDYVPVSEDGVYPAGMPAAGGGVKLVVPGAAGIVTGHFRGAIGAFVGR